MVDKNFERFVDEVMEAGFEYDDLVRVVGGYGREGIDKFDAEKLLSDFCGVRYRYTFLYIAITIVHAIARPKKDHKQSVKHLKRASVLLAELIHQMERLHDSAEIEDQGEEGDQGESKGGGESPT